jgi:hypothetical protein
LQNFPGETGEGKPLYLAQRHPRTVVTGAHVASIDQNLKIGDRD